MSVRVPAVLVAGWLATVSCLGRTPLEPLPAGGIHVLFVGNSLTYTNDLPATVATLGNMSGDTIRVAAAVGPDLALVDHLNGATNAIARIQQGGWDFVILQQGPSTLPLNRDSLILWTQWFDPYIKGVGAKPSLLMVWPSIDRRDYFDEVRKSYQLAAQAVDGVFMPAGAAWLEAWAADGSISLYGPDGYHPTPLGTLTAAFVVYERVTGKDCRNLKSATMAAMVGNGQMVTEATMRILQEAAHAANAAYP